MRGHKLNIVLGIVAVFFIGTTAFLASALTAKSGGPQGVFSAPPAPPSPQCVTLGEDKADTLVRFQAVASTYASGWAFFVRINDGDLQWRSLDDIGGDLAQGKKVEILYFCPSSVTQ